MLRYMQQRVSLVTLGVADIHRARRFYEAIGWSGESPDDDVVFFQAPGMIVALWGRAKLAADSVVTDTGGWGGVALAHNVGSPAEVDEILAAAGAAGATIGRSGAPTFYGGYSGIFIDPDGHPWEIAHNPGWILDADGTVRLR
jgi:predicted lactoylglutathione lyase